MTAQMWVLRHHAPDGPCEAVAAFTSEELLAAWLDALPAERHSGPGYYAWELVPVDPAP